MLDHLPPPDPTHHAHSFAKCSADHTEQLLSETPALATEQQNWQAESRKELAPCFQAYPPVLENVTLQCRIQKN